MIHRLEALAELLQGTPLAGRTIISLPVRETEAAALAIEITFEQILPGWQLLRHLVDQTGRWPVVITCWSRQPGATWTENLQDQDLFSPFFFAEEYPDTSPSAIIQRAASVDLASFLQAQAEIYNRLDMAEIAAEIEQTRTQFGLAPAVDAIEPFGEEMTEIDLQRWLFNWEVNQLEPEQSCAAPDRRYLEWFEPRDQPLALILLPTPHSWETLAYINWFGGRSAQAIALLKKWHHQYEAELVCHYGTMLQLLVHQKPQSPAAAFELAWEQMAVAQCTTLLPGISLRDHARTLLHCDRWFLHERP